MKKIFVWKDKIYFFVNLYTPKEINLLKRYYWLKKIEIGAINKL